MQHPCKRTCYVRATGVSFRKNVRLYDMTSPQKNKNATKEANSIILLVMLHEKPVAVEYMLVDVQRERAVEKLDIRTEER